MGKLEDRSRKSGVGSPMTDDRSLELEDGRWESEVRRLVGIGDWSLGIRRGFLHPTTGCALDLREVVACQPVEAGMNSGEVRAEGKKTVDG